MNKIILINTDTFKATGAFLSYQAAESAAQRVRYNYVIVDDHVDLLGLFSGPELVKLYNANRPRETAKVTKFQDKATGAKRLIALLQEEVTTTPQAVSAAIKQVKAVGSTKKGTTLPRPSSGRLIRELLQRGQTDDEAILAQVKRDFPASKATKKDISWNRWKLKQEVTA